MIAADQLSTALGGLYAAYVACIDEGRFGDWPDFFTEDCRYRIVPRENYDRGLPLGTLDLHGLGMLRDRVYGIESTLFHAPYYQRHIVGLPHVLARHGDILEVEANYLVIRTKRDCPSEIFNAGRYVDRVATSGDRLLFQSKFCVFDSELIPNSLIYPI
ncbi:salicylate 5-hydroxylase small subunit [Sphingopyxis sp. YR583]|uniref:aromatic-ring-hydroxylating dioxygenase subunit beta n=1 Tax=Sphingopyxis sp. YR583 TaxID=1881047 RepID=UPI0008A79E00|nr:aromatic-ring-hydroxylating dioxygenase subunit beta [Sphingopyxis sp. YR583]SEH19142.1 salicylate 5-hydroxylase small subunit [Sphingopyxis sp. YR583]